MLSDDLTRMAREAGLHLPYWDDDQDPQSNPPSGWAMVSPIGPPLELFARAVERAAYERAAQECELQITGSDYHFLATHGHWDHMAQAATNCAAAIRALGRRHD